MAVEITKDKRKGLIATILIHAIVLLIMLQWMMRTDKVMADDDEGLTVTFAASASGGASSASSSDAEAAQVNPEETPTPEERVTPPQPSQVTAETTTAEKAPEVKASEHKQTEPKQKTLDPTVGSLIKGLGKKKGTKKTGEGEGGDDTDGKSSGKGNLGPNGDGWSGDGLNGFNISGEGVSTGQFGQEGVIYLKVCVDRYGKIYESEIDYSKPNKNSSGELIELAKKKAKQYTFVPKAGTREGGCGTFRVTFEFND